MIIQPASENNIIHGQARVMGGVVARTGQTAWILPGGRYTTNKVRALTVAKAINDILSTRASTD